MKLPKKGSDTVKVNGLSNYHCKILSPLFTSYGMDKAGKYVDEKLDYHTFVSMYLS